MCVLRLDFVTMVDTYVCSVVVHTTCTVVGVWLLLLLVLLFTYVDYATYAGVVAVVDVDIGDDGCMINVNCVVGACGYDGHFLLSLT